MTMMAHPEVTTTCPHRHLSGCKDGHASWAFPIWIALLFGACMTFSIFAQPKLVPPSRQSPTPSVPPPVQKISEHTFQIGLVQFDSREKTVTIPGFVNLTNAPFEYALVHANGKTHESLLRTDAAPYHVHLALLFLGVKPPEYDPNRAKDFPEGPALNVFVLSPIENGFRTNRLESWIRNTQTKKVLESGPWIDNGSRLINGQFLAQRDGSIISLVTDPDALINNPRPGHDDDRIWAPLEKGLPTHGTPVQIILKLQERSTP